MSGEALNLRHRAATVVGDDGERYDLREGRLPDDLPSDVVAKLKAIPGAIGDPIDPTEALGSGTLGDAAEDVMAGVRPAPTSVASGFPEGAADPDGGNQPGAEGDSGGSGGSSSELPDDAPDPATADVGELAQYIDANNLNAAQTVALAGDTPEGASKVLEAERTASGGDGRSTVVKPLTAKAGGS